MSKIRVWLERRFRDTRHAAIWMASELGQRLSGDRPTAVSPMLTDLGAAVAKDPFSPVADAPRGTVAMPNHVLASQHT